MGSLAFLPVEYMYDFFRSCRWSKASPLAPRERSIYYDIILLAHTIEKGLSQPVPRPGFGVQKISALLKLAERYERAWDPFPLEKTYGALLEYGSWHAENGEEMGSLAPAILAFLAKAESLGLKPKGGLKSLDQGEMAEAGQKSGRDLLQSRYSCRRFQNQIVPVKEVRRLIELAQRAPSQCNRQSVRVHCYQKPEDIRLLLGLQRGAAGFSDNVSNLFVISSQLAAWSGCNARNQCFVDGALFTMQLALACHSAGIGTCPLNLAVGNWRERKIRIAGRIPHDERLIVMMAFGYPSDKDSKLVVAKSERIDPDTVVQCHI